MASSRPWPFDDDDDRPSGSVRPLSQADLQAILAHLNNDPDELLAGTSADRPLTAMRAPASVGRPGGSAQARWRRQWVAEWATWTRTLPWRVAAALGIGAAGGLLGSLLASRPSLVLGTLAAVAAGVGLRFRPSPDAIAWRRGAAGERRTARLLGPLERHGWAVLHDLAIPGSRANIDHLAIGPGGVFVIDSKHYRGHLRLDAVGKLWHGRHPLAPTFRFRAVSTAAESRRSVIIFAAGRTTGGLRANPESRRNAHLHRHPQGLPEKPSILGGPTLLRDAGVVTIVTTVRQVGEDEFELVSQTFFGEHVPHPFQR